MTEAASPDSAPEPARIPKILTVVWVGPHDPPTMLIDTWSTKHGGDRGWFFAPCRSHLQDFENQDQILHRYARREYNGVADLIRYELLYKYGGFAVDADSECLTALDEGPIDFLQNDRALACFENELARPGMIGCGFLGATKGHPFFRACIDECKKADWNEQAWKAVGPVLMTRVAARMPDQIRVFPAKTFNPVHYSGQEAPGDHPVYARQCWGTTKTYNTLRKWPCQCEECRVNMLRAPWA